MIGVSGLAGVGKDHVADLLVRDHGAVKVALADPIKRAAREIFDFTETQLWGPSSARNAPDERYPREHTWREGSALCACCGAGFSIETYEGKCFLTPRYSLQMLGSDYGRHCYPDVWIDYIVRVAKTLDAGNYTYTQKAGLLVQYGFPKRAVVVPDVRFWNEVEGLKKAGAKLVRVRRVGFEKPKWDHPSETEQMGIPDSEFDYVLENDSTLEALGEKVDEMWKELSK